MDEAFDWEEEFDPLDPWSPLGLSLHFAKEEGRTVDVWLRDDDAIAVTPQLDRLAELSRRYEVPVLLAVIPEPATADLANFVADKPLFTMAQHGFSHTNHAAPGDRACEIGGDRPLDAVLADLSSGRDMMGTLFGPGTDILVPPWNRIASPVLPHLPGLGFGALSTFRDTNRDAPGATVINPDLDIIDWRRGRRCRPLERMVIELGLAIEDGKPFGILTHHRVHDDRAWEFLFGAFSLLHESGVVRFRSAAELRADKASAEA